VRQRDPAPAEVTQRQYGFSPSHDDPPSGSWNAAQADPHSQFKYWIVGRVLGSHGLSGRLVDVGCGSGLLQRHLISLGWQDTVGVEPSGNPTGRQIGLEVYSEPVDTFLLRPGMARGFDVAVANHVIEHCYEPLALLRQLRELVRPGGHVLIATPNIHGLSMRWKTLASRLGWKARPFRHLDYPKHLVLFHRSNLPRLVQSAGLEVVETSTYTRASGDASAGQRRFWLWDQLRLGDNMLVLARRHAS
jgi:SAM-dependent methyltransferase